MGRHTGPTCKKCRREGKKLFLKGEKCATEKCPYARRSYPPGQHGKMANRRPSEYGIRLREKQVARKIYGVNERQFEKYFEKAANTKGATGEKLLEMLERRLDNVVFRLGFSASRQAARQMVRHGGVDVNGKRTNIPSFQVREGDAVKVGPKYTVLVKGWQAKNEDYLPPEWLTLNGEIEGKVTAIPRRENIDSALEEHLIVEYYSR